MTVISHMLHTRNQAFHQAHDYHNTVQNILCATPVYYRNVVQILLCATPVYYRITVQNLLCARV